MIFGPVDYTQVVFRDYKAKYLESCDCETSENQENTRKRKNSEQLSHLGSSGVQNFHKACALCPSPTIRSQHCP